MLLKGGCQMALKIEKVYAETLPALRLIGRRCLCTPEDFVAKWREWFENGWFEQIEKLGVAPENGDAYIGATQNDSYWIGMLFPTGTHVPDGFEYADIPTSRYAVFGLYGKKDGELFGEEGITLVIGEMGKQGLVMSEGGWGLERYRRTLSTAQDKKVGILFEFLNSIV